MNGDVFEALRFQKLMNRKAYKTSMAGDKNFTFRVHPSSNQSIVLTVGSTMEVDGLNLRSI